MDTVVHGFFSDANIANFRVFVKKKCNFFTNPAAGLRCRCIPYYVFVKDAVAVYISAL